MLHRTPSVCNSIEEQIPGISLEDAFSFIASAHTRVDESPASDVTGWFTFYRLNDNP
ncbi:MAG TPA: hypothetical protein VMS29_08645 [Pyrinomonadaceae bacterium]|nr:hypothetical protein [Pyrinomonadaceae bacterium]